jgi:peptidoglycan/LPS O-acetylase OafA/YrhL
VTCILTVVIALISYNVYETRLMAIGKRITNKEGGFMAFLESK